MHARPGATPPPIERERFGGSQRRERPDDADAPVSRSDLSKGPQELLEHRASRCERDTASVLTPAIVPVAEHPAVPPDAGDVQDLGVRDPDEGS